MAGNGSKKRDRSPGPMMKRALESQARAREELKAARKKGDQMAIAVKLAALEDADTELRVANADRFRQIASVRGGTVISALGDLTKLCLNRRYTVTPADAKAITAPIEESLRLMRLSLEAAVLRSLEPAARQAIVFEQATAGA